MTKPLIVAMQRNGSKPFDNEVLRTKTTWTDEELEQELELLNLAHMHLLNLGDRYHVICDDLQRLWQARTSMQRSRGNEGSRMSERAQKRQCEECNGTGIKETKSISLSGRTILDSQTCVSCEGTGKK